MPIRFAKKSNSNDNNNMSKKMTEIDRKWRNISSSSEMPVQEFNDVNWVPMTRNQKTRRPINPSSKYLTNIFTVGQVRDRVCLWV